MIIRTSYFVHRTSKKSLLVLAVTAFIVYAACATAMAVELPDGIKGYYKDKVSSAPGRSEGVGPTKKPKKQQGVDIGRRDSKEYDFGDESSPFLVSKAWEALNEREKEAVFAYTLKCIELYQDEALKEQALLTGFAPTGSEASYVSLNDIATCYFIQGEFYKYNKDWKRSRDAYEKVMDDFSFAQCWDPRGWWWKPSEISQGEIKKIDLGYYEQK